MSEKKSKIKIADVAFIGVAIAAAMLLSYIESFFSVGIPGVKLGMPNIFIIVILYRFGLWQSASVSVIRALLTALLFGSMMSLWYSLAGAALSLLAMWLLKKTNRFSPLGVSIAGGVLHNAGQIAVAVLVTGVKEIAFYMPVLVISGTIAGVVVGIAASVLIKKLPDFSKIR